MTQYIQSDVRQKRFIWADRAALVAGFLFSLLLICFWSLAFLVVGNLGARHMWAPFGVLGIELEILTVGSIWFAMRLVDFLVGGSTYRLLGYKPAPKSFDLHMPLSTEPDIISVKRMQETI